MAFRRARDLLRHGLWRLPDAHGPVSSALCEWLAAEGFVVAHCVDVTLCGMAVALAVACHTLELVMSKSDKHTSRSVEWSPMSDPAGTRTENAVSIDDKDDDWVDVELWVEEAVLVPQRSVVQSPPPPLDRPRAPLVAAYGVCGTAVSREAQGGALNACF